MQTHLFKGGQRVLRRMQGTSAVTAEAKTAKEGGHLKKADVLMQ